jgi:uncharacterized membrane protein YiaA
MSEDLTKKGRYSFFLIMSVVGLFAVLAGFAKTFIMPVTAGNFKAPFTIYLHGALALGWVVLFMTQTFLIHNKNYRAHMTLGILGIFIAVGVSVTMLPAGLHQAQRELKEGLGETAISGIVGTLTSAIIFLSLVIAGIVNRNNSEWHKRLMLLATIVVLWPAWFRFRHYFPSVPRPDIWFAVVLADSLIVISWIRDKIVNNKVHPALIYVGLFIIIEHIFEVITFDNTSWRYFARLIYAFLTT